MRRMVKNTRIFLITKKMKILYCFFAVSLENLKIVKYHTFWKKQFFLSYAVKVKMKRKNI